ncbi:MAG: hypothetical protein HYS81_02840 [Candidatus Aenigmatarchaeota archaeon]|nr:MAG: hypothetical protein HYS81_02840 [Candidatus Aenigmarchaeota archaeon]
MVLMAVPFSWDEDESGENGPPAGPYVGPFQLREQILREKKMEDAHRLHFAIQNIRASPGYKLLDDQYDGFKWRLDSASQSYGHVELEQWLEPTLDVVQDGFKRLKERGVDPVAGLNMMGVDPDTLRELEELMRRHDKKIERVVTRKSEELMEEIDELKEYEERRDATARDDGLNAAILGGWGLAGTTLAVLGGQIAEKIAGIGEGVNSNTLRAIGYGMTGSSAATLLALAAYEWKKNEIDAGIEDTKELMIDGAAYAADGFRAARKKVAGAFATPPGVLDWFIGSPSGERRKHGKNGRGSD